jgi:hypothetical protein
VRHRASRQRQDDHDAGRSPRLAQRGYRVIGCAVKGEAARQLAADAAIDADTVALLLTRAGSGQRVLDEHSVLIVDEASTLGDRDLLALLRVTETAGATLRLIGDPAQHGSIPAGGSFTHIVTHSPASDIPQLTTARRLLDPGEQARAELVRGGRISDALDALQASGQLILSDRDVDTYAAMLDRWHHHRQAGDPHPMVHGRNRQRRLLNQLAQAILAADGTVDLHRAVATSDGRRLAVGDEVIARHGDRRIHPPQRPAAWMRNGTTGRIVAIHPGPTPAQDRIIIDTAGGLIDCGRPVFNRRRGGIDHAYAVTSYAVQGSTRTASTSAVTATTSRSELYVDITRGRDSNHLYATRRLGHDGDTEHHLPTVAVDTMTLLRQRLAGGNGRTALGTDPTALDVANTKSKRTLRGLLAARRRGEPGPVDVAIKRTADAIRRQARSAPPDELTAILPPRPTCPHLAKRWDTAAGAVAVHHAANPPRRRRPPAGRPPIERLLGPRPEGDDGNRWDRLADGLARLAGDITLRTINDWARRRRLPPITDDDDVRGELDRLALNGQLADIDPNNVYDLLARLDASHPGEAIDTIDGPNDRRQRHAHVHRTGAERILRRRSGREVG